MDYREDVIKHRHDIDVGLELIRLMLLDGNDMVALGHVKTAMRHLDALKMICEEIIVGDEE